MTNPRCRTLCGALCAARCRHVSITYVLTSASSDAVPSTVHAPFGKMREWMLAWHLRRTVLRNGCASVMRDTVQSPCVALHANCATHSAAQILCGYVRCADPPPTPTPHPHPPYGHRRAVRRSLKGNGCCTRLRTVMTMKYVLLEMQCTKARNGCAWVLLR